LTSLATWSGFTCDAMKYATFASAVVGGDETIWAGERHGDVGVEELMVGATTSRTRWSFPGTAGAPAR
jgi:hypothetical protein